MTKRITTLAAILLVSAQAADADPHSSQPTYTLSQDTASCASLELYRTLIDAETNDPAYFSELLNFRDECILLPAGTSYHPIDIGLANDTSRVELDLEGRHYYAYISTTAVEDSL